jgi:hypothetical protein
LLKIDKENLKRIKMGHPVKYGQFLIDRYLAGNGLGWIVQAPGQKPFISRNPEQVLGYITAGETKDLGEY